MAFADLVNRLKDSGYVATDEYEHPTDLPITVEAVGNRKRPVAHIEADPVGVEASTPDPQGTAKMGLGKSKMSHEQQNEIDSAMSGSSDARDIAKLLSDYDAANKQAHMDKAMNGFTRAGMTMGHAFGGEKPDEAFLQHADQLANQPVEDVQNRQKLKYGLQDQSRKNRTTDMDNQHVAQEMDLGDTVIDKNGLANDNERNLQDKTSPASAMARSIARKNGYQVPDEASAKDVLDNMPLLKADMDMIEKAAHEKASDERTNKIVGAGIQKGRENNATDIAKKELDAAAQANKDMSGRQADVVTKIASRMKPGFTFKGLKQGMIPNEHAKTQADELEGRYKNATRIGLSIVNNLEHSPRNIPASELWSQMRTDIADLIETRTKLKGDGVMNGKDWDHAMMAIGDPNGFTQWLNQGGLTQMKRMIMNAKGEFDDRMGAYGYVPGNMSIKDIQENLPGAMGGSGGNTLQPNQESFNTVWGATGIKTPPPQFNKRGNPSNTPDIPPSNAPNADVLRAKLKALRGGQ